MTLKQKRDLIAKALDSCNQRLSYMAQDSNPQVLLMYTKNKGYQAALEDVLLLIDGDSTRIKCLI